MRITSTIEDLDEDRWQYVQRLVKTFYEFTEDMTRVCVTFVRGAEERHAEMPLGAYTGLMMGLGLVKTSVRLSQILTDLAAGMDTSQGVESPETSRKADQ